MLLNKSRSKRSVNRDMELTFQLEGNKRLLPIEKVTTEINEEELYQKERENCNTIRLISTINPICSNVLYNPLTEVVYKEGGDDMLLFNPNNNSLEEVELSNLPLIGRTSFSGATELIRDTQLSRYDDIKYHCGMDIFNNHIMRNTTFKTVCQNGDDNFNTLSDTMRYYNGDDVEYYNDNIDNNIASEPEGQLHLYTADDVLTFDESLEQNLKIENGWVGFKNASNMPVYENNKKVPLNNVINNKQACDFICLAPEKDLFSFTPKYNKHQNRLEKNWHYHITYPSSATTNVPYIRRGTNSLRIVYFDENTKNSGSKSGIKIYSITKHGLSVDDVINIYNGDVMIMKNSRVIFVEDEFTFTCERNDVIISNGWIDTTKDEWSGLTSASGVTISGSSLPFISSNIFSFTDSDKITLIQKGDKLTISGKTKGYTTYVLPNGSVNIDPNTQDITYKQVVSGEEVEYYVRIFSLLPNWRFADEKPTTYNIYKSNSELIKKCQIGFENHISNLAFAKNVYGDDITQIVFTDDINIGELKDNLGRPLTEVYLTLLKNNKGYKEWYDEDNWDGTTLKFSGDTQEIEYSHMFGKLNCGFNLSPHALKLENDMILGHITRMTNIGNDVLSGLTNINNSSTDEIDILNDKNYYGDLCCLSRIVYGERVIDEAMGRFNTAQRESAWDLKPFKEDMEYDDYDVHDFKITTTYISDDIETSEGYCYKMHYRIPIKTYSNELEYQYPEVSKIKKQKTYLSEDSSKKIYSGSIMTDIEHYLENNDIFLLYDINNAVWYNGEVISVKSLYEFDCKINIDCDDKENNIQFSGITDDNRLQYRILRKEVTIPDYALLTKDGTHRYIWRWLLQNGNDSYSTNEVYPFTNGALYIHQNINVYVKRQDPNEYVPKFNGSYFKVSPIHLDVSKENNYKSEGDIVC